MDPSWSPDGSKIAFAADRSGDYEVYVMNADGTGLTRLTFNAARASYGLQIAEIVSIDSGFRMVSEYTPMGSAAGHIDGLGYLWDILDRHAGEFDAVAIASVIDIPAHLHRDYYAEAGRILNPWGGVEAILTHAISSKYGVPAAHSPMLESREVAEMDLGVVDPRMAAEVVSVTFMQSVLRGLQNSPALVLPDAGDSISINDISCLVIPHGCIGIPTLAALRQGVPVIAVKENRNLMRNDLGALPWARSQLHVVANYWEAAGVLAALRAGIDPATVRRPLNPVRLPFHKAVESTPQPDRAGR